MSVRSATAERTVFAEALAARRSGTASREPLWLREIRDRAARRFLATGFPTPSDEAWRATSVAAIAATPFGGVPSPEAAPARLEGSSPLVAPSGPRAIFVDGRFSPALSDLSGLPSGLTVRSLRDALADGAASLEGSLGRLVSVDDHPFAALNTALFEDGVVVRAAARCDVPDPFEIVHLATSGSTPYAVHPRVVVIAEPGSRLPVVETFLAAGPGVYLTNAVTEIVAAEDATVEHHRVQAEGIEAFHVAAVAGRLERNARLASHNVSLGAALARHDIGARLERNARLVSHNVSLGAALARHDIGARLDGEGAEAQLWGLFLVDGHQHVDNHTCLDHAKPHCPSWEMYKGILAGAARSVFCGRIIVRPDAQKTDAKQSNKNLLLSREALAHTRPQLEIFANDVKCTHGATIGRLDDDAIFYLRSRGIGRDEAYDLMVHAFAGDVLDRIRHVALRERIADEISRRLPRQVSG